MKKVFYLDDSTASITLIKKCLKEMAETTGVATLPEAQNILDKAKFDLILFDYQIGSLTSLELIEHVRKESHLNKNTPIILVTAFRSEGLFFKASKLGVNDYIFKPYSREAMVNLVTDYLENPNKVREAKPNHLIAQCVTWNVGNKFYQYSPDLFELVEDSTWEGCGMKMKERYIQAKKNATAEVTIVHHTVPFFEE